MIITCKECKKEVEVINKRFKMCPTCSKNKQLQRCRDYKNKNKDNTKQYNKEYKQENKDAISLYNTTYNIENRDRLYNTKNEDKQIQLIKCL